MQLISQGAEAKLFKEKNTVIKDRFEKTYRHKQLDTQLRCARTRHEAKILEKLQKIGFPAPKVLGVDNDKLELEFIDGKLVKDILDEKSAKEIGKLIAMLHKNNIIHGDLTTSNMIMNKKLYVIDFGLGFTSLKIEDKAVDLHLLDRALESKHHTLYPKIFETIKEEYRKHYPDADTVLRRLEIVNKRGRNKEKY